MKYIPLAISALNFAAGTWHYSGSFAGALNFFMAIIFFGIYLDERSIKTN